MVGVGNHQNCFSSLVVQSLGDGGGAREIIVAPFITGNDLFKVYDRGRCDAFSSSYTKFEAPRFWNDPSLLYFFTDLYT